MQDSLPASRILSLSYPPQQVSDPTADLIGQWDVKSVPGAPSYIVEIGDGYYILAIPEDSGYEGNKFESDRREIDGWYVVSYKPSDTFAMTIKYRFKDINTLECIAVFSDGGEMFYTLYRRTEPVEIEIVGP